MAYPSVTNFLENGVAYKLDASKLNQNFSDIIAGTSDGTKDIRCDSLSAEGQHTITGYSKLGGSEALKIITTQYTLSAADLAGTELINIYLGYSYLPTKIRGMILSIYQIDTDGLRNNQYYPDSIKNVSYYYSNQIYIDLRGSSYSAGDIINVMVVIAE
jgi:hypothetical protein